MSNTLSILEKIKKKINKLDEHKDEEQYENFDESQEASSLDNEFEDINDTSHSEGQGHDVILEREIEDSFSDNDLENVNFTKERQEGEDFEDFDGLREEDNKNIIGGNGTVLNNEDGNYPEDDFNFEDLENNEDEILKFKDEKEDINLESEEKNEVQSEDDEEFGSLSDQNVESDQKVNNIDSNDEELGFEEGVDFDSELLEDENKENIAKEDENWQEENDEMQIDDNLEDEQGKNYEIDNLHSEKDQLVDFEDTELNYGSKDYEAQEKEDLPNVENIDKEHVDSKAEIEDNFAHDNKIDKGHFLSEDFENINSLSGKFEEDLNNSNVDEGFELNSDQDFESETAKREGYENELLPDLKSKIKNDFSDQDNPSFKKTDNVEFENKGQENHSYDNNDTFAEDHDLDLKDAENENGIFEEDKEIEVSNELENSDLSDFSYQNGDEEFKKEVFEEEFEKYMQTQKKPDEESKSEIKLNLEQNLDSEEGENLSFSEGYQDNNSVNDKEDIQNESEVNDKKSSQENNESFDEEDIDLDQFDIGNFVENDAKENIQEKVDDDSNSGDLNSFSNFNQDIKDNFADEKRDYSLEGKSGDEQEYYNSKASNKVGEDESFKKQDIEEEMKDAFSEIDLNDDFSDDGKFDKYDENEKIHKNEPKEDVLSNKYIEVSDKSSSDSENDNEYKNEFKHDPDSSEENDFIIGENLSQKISDSIGSLVATKKMAKKIDNVSKSELMQNVATELMRPKLEEWFERNLPDLVEEVVRQEIKNIINNANKEDK